MSLEIALSLVLAVRLECDGVETELANQIDCYDRHA